MSPSGKPQRSFSAKLTTVPAEHPGPTEEATTPNNGSCPLLVKRGGLEVLQRFPVHRWEGETTLLLRENSSILLASVVILMASPKVAKSRFVKRQLWQPTRVSIPQSFLTTKISGVSH